MKKSVSVLLAVIIAVSAVICFSGTTVSAAINEKGSAVARQVNDEGIVLLKNENGALPLKTKQGIAIFGEAQANHYDTKLDTLTEQRGYIPFGAGSTRSCNDEEIIAPLDAFRNAAKEETITVYEAISAEYEKNPDYIPDDAAISAAAYEAETAILFISRWGGECRDFAKEDWSLTDSEQALLAKLRASFKKVVAVLNTGNAIDTSWDESVDALVFAGYGGFQGGQGICDCLTGSKNFSGKLTTTWATSLEAYPTNDAFFSSSAQEYTEDIFLGYRYFETFAKDKVKYPFGYGLSYTDFSIEASFTQDGDTVKVSAKVTNTGSLPGKEVVQVYFAAPAGKLPKAAMELCAFDKTNTLKPNESQTLTLEFSVNDMSSYDDVGKTGKTSAYVLEAGDYNIFVGNSVRNAEENNIGKINIASLTVVEQLSAQVITNLKTRLNETGGTEEIPVITKQDETKEEAAATPTPAPTAVPANDDEIVIEAEDYDDCDGNDGGPNGEGMPGTAMYMDSETGEWESYEGSNLANTWRGNAMSVYEVRLNQGGTFNVTLRASTRLDYTAVITFYTSTDGKTYKEATKSEVIPDTFTLNPDASNPYHNYIDVKCTNKITLDSGINYIKLTFTGAPNVDFFTLTRVGKAETVEATATPAPTATPSPTPYTVTEPEDKDTYYKLADVTSGKITLDEFVAQMKTSELASFFVSYSGNKAGASNAVCAKYGFSQFSMSDSSQGIGSGSTSYPCETLMAQTWNLRLAAAYALSIASEVYTCGRDMILTPAVNLHRHPLSGRNFEYYSEDPFISGKFATAVIENIQSVGVGTCIKHFVCNEIEKNKLQSDSRVSERALRELYLEPFRMAVTTAKPFGVMSSYNIVNGTAVSQNSDLLINILRKEWGFEGFVTGDWNNDKDIVKEINNGNNVREPEKNCDIDKIITAIEKGRITRETLETGAKQVLYVIMRSHSYYITNATCGGAHTYENGICTKCYTFDASTLGALPDRIQTLLDDVASAENVTEGNAGSSGSAVLPIIITVAAVAVIGGVAAIVIVKKKKKA